MTDEQRVQQDGDLCRRGEGGGRGGGGKDRDTEQSRTERERERGGGGGGEQRTGVYSRRKRYVQVRSFVCFEVT